MSEYPYDGVISADILREAFWNTAEAARQRLIDSPRPYVEVADGEIYERDYFDGTMTREFWEHMARVLKDG